MCMCVCTCIRVRNCITVQCVYPHNTHTTTHRNSCKTLYTYTLCPHFCHGTHKNTHRDQQQIMRYSSCNETVTDKYRNTRHATQPERNTVGLVRERRADKSQTRHNLLPMHDITRGQNGSRQSKHQKVVRLPEQRCLLALTHSSGSLSTRQLDVMSRKKAQQQHLQRRRGLVQIRI